MNVTAKSVIFDIKNNHGGGYIGIRSVEFKFDGGLLALTETDFTAYETTNSGTNCVAKYVFDTSTSKTGGYALNSWLSSASSVHQRIIVVFNTEQKFDEIVINNFHDSGTVITYGAKLIKISSSADSITSTVFSEEIPNSRILWLDELIVHSAADVAEDQDSYAGTKVYLSKFPVGYSTDYVKATTYYNTSYYPWYGVNPLFFPVGAYTSKSWVSTTPGVSNQKFNVDLGPIQVIKRLYLENSHTSGASTNQGIKNFNVYGTNSSAAFSNTTYSNIDDLTLLGSFIAAEHTAVDESDPQYFDLSDNSDGYQYYVLRIVDNYGGTVMGFRHIQFQTDITFDLNTVSDINSIRLVIAHEDVVSNLIDFPVRINLSAVSGKSAYDCSAIFTELGTTDFLKLAIADIDTDKQCFIEIENWESDKAQLWVRIPLISSSVDTILKLYYEADNLDNIDYVGVTGNFGNSVEEITPEETYSDSSAATNFTRRQFIAAAVISGTGTRARIKFLYGSASYTLDDVWVALRTGDETDAWDYEDGTQIQVTRNGDDSILITATGQYSDWIDLPEAIDGSKDIFIGYTSTEALARGADLPTGHTIHYKTTITSENGTADVTGYSTQTLGWNSIALIEAFDPSPNQMVWDKNFIAVFHMAQDPSGDAPQILDSTGNALHLTSEGTMLTEDLIDGDVGKAIAFDGTNDALESTGNHGITGGYGKTLEISVNDVVLGSLDHFLDMGTRVAGKGLINHIGASGNQVVVSLFSYSATFGDTDLTDAAFHNVAIAYRGSLTSDIALYDNGVEQTRTALSEGIINTADSTIRVCKQSLDAYYLNTEVNEVRISNTDRSEDWLIVTHDSNIDDLITFASGVLARIATRIDEIYSLSEIVTKRIDQIYGLKLVTDIIKLWDITSTAINITVLLYGLRAGTYVVEQYGDVPVIKVLVNQYYSDAGQPVSRYILPYGDAYSREARVELLWDIASNPANTCVQLYSITQSSIVQFIDSLYDLDPINKVQVYRDLYYSLLAQDLLQYSLEVSVVVNGMVVDFNSINIEASNDQYCISCDIQLASAADYQLCQYLADVVVTIDLQEFILFVDSRSRSISRGSVTYSISLLSPTAKLDVPYSQPLTDSLLDGTWVQSLVVAMAALQGITVDYQIMDWFIPGHSISINDETPLTVIRNVVNAVGGVPQTKPNGDLLIISKYAVSPENWHSVIPDKMLTAAADIESLTETLDIRDGFNAFIISDQGSSSESIRLEEKPIDSMSKHVRGYRIPFDDGPFNLLTSGGSEVSVERYAYPIDDLIIPEVLKPEDSEWEIVEFIDWQGTTAYPIYDLIAWDWIQDDLGDVGDLGAFQISEDGTLSVINQSAVPSESLLRIRYKTKFWLWTIRGPADIPIQFYVPEIEDE